MCEFKRGDKVRIRDDITTLEREPPGINSEMRQMGGKVCTVQTAARDRCTLNEVPYLWLYKWLEPYEDEVDIDIEVPDISDIL